MKKPISWLMACSSQAVIELKRWPLWLPLITLLLAVSLRIARVDQYYSGLMTTHGLYGLLAFKHDTAVTGLIVLLHLTGYLVRFRVLSIALRLAAWLLMMVYVADLFVFAQFNLRFTLNDFIRLGVPGKAIVDVVDGFVRNPKNAPVTLVMALAVASVLAVFPKLSPKNIRAKMLGVLASPILMGVFVWPDHVVYNNDWAYRNVFEANAMAGVRTPYGAEMTQAARGWSEKQDSQLQCVPGLDSGRNVILVVMESLSSHHSHYLSGLSDWVPRVDALARQNYVWNNFYANGNNTSYGLIALLTGHDPLTANNVHDYGRFYRLSDALPFRMKQNGYRTAFLTPGDLGFLEVGKWLDSIGFDYVEGHDAPFYDGMERYHFSAVPDGPFYARSLQWIEGNKSPFFLTLLTVSTHLPYMNPETKEKSEVASFRYADKAFDQFVADLTRRGYFAKGGVLLLTGDHHAMTRLRPEEIEQYGNSADARVPLIAIGQGLNLSRQTSGPYQQADVPASIDYLTGKRACFSNRQRNLFVPESGSASRCILHMRGDREDLIDTFCGNQFGQVRIDADKTGVWDGEIAGADQLVREINAERIGWFLRRQASGAVLRELPTPVTHN